MRAYRPRLSTRERARVAARRAGIPNNYTLYKDPYGRIALAWRNGEGLHFETLKDVEKAAGKEPK